MPATYEPPNPVPGTEQGGLFSSSDLSFPVDTARADDSVSSNLNQVTSQDSPLMNAARVEGLKLANKRGISNSSMAVGAAQDAMIRQALPIASQQASQNFQRNQGARTFEYGMAAQEFDQGFRSDLFDRDAALRAYLQSSDQTFQSNESQLNRELQERLNNWQLDSSDRNAAMAAITNLEQLYDQKVQGLMNNQALSAADRDRFLLSERRLRDTRLHFIEQMYQVELDWDVTP
jgi:uncharacterized protein YijF (DUF1287 family)